MAMRGLRMRVRGHVFDIDLNDSDTAEAIWLATPFEGYTNVWGDEIYFEIPVKVELENGRSVMEVGEVAYWPTGRALCLFYGPTPVSEGREPRAISDVSPVGRVRGDPKELAKIGDRRHVVIESL